MMNAHYNKILHAELGKRGLMEMKADIIGEFTNGRTNSSKELTDAEARELIRILPNPSKGEGSWKPKPGDAMRKKILAMAAEIGWKNNGKIDVQRVNAWCEKYSSFKKPLNAHTTEELNKLVNQFERFYVDTMNRI
jgi:hypothetical protein